MTRPARRATAWTRWWNGRATEVWLVDTAGIRRRGHIERGIEQHSVLRAMRSMQHADVGVVVIDADEGPTQQDAHVAGFVLDAGKGRDGGGKQVGPGARERGRWRGWSTTWPASSTSYRKARWRGFRPKRAETWITCCRWRWRFTGFGSNASQPRA